jgi:hypothetical protein
VLGVAHVEVDAREVGAVEVLARRREDLVALDQEVPAVVIARGRPTEIAAGRQVGVLVGLGLGRLTVGLECRVVEVAVASEDAGRVLQLVDADGDPLQLEAVCEDVRRTSGARIRVRDASHDLGEGNRRQDERGCPSRASYEDSSHDLSLSLEDRRGDSYRAATAPAVADL